MSLHVVTIGHPMTEKWECKGVKVPSYVNLRYYVTHSVPKEKRTTHWGPFDSEEEAYRVSGMPRPKTELEDLWDFVNRYYDYLDQYRLVDQVSTSHYAKMSELKAKWKR